MRALTLTALLCLSSVALAQGKVLPPPPGRPTQPPPAPSPTLVVVEREVWESRLARLEELLSDAQEKSERQARKKVQRAREELLEVRQLLSRAAPLGTYLPPTQTVQPMPPPELRRLLQALERESFGRDQLRVLSEAAPYNHFLVGQVLELLRPFDFANEKLEAVRVLKPFILDPQESWRLYDAFTHSSDKDKLRKILN